MDKRGGVLLKVHEKCEAKGRAFRDTSHEGKSNREKLQGVKEEGNPVNNNRETRAFAGGERLLLQQARNAFQL